MKRLTIDLGQAQAKLTMQNATARVPGLGVVRDAPSAMVVTIGAQAAAGLPLSMTIEGEPLKRLEAQVLQIAGAGRGRQEPKPSQSHATSSDLSDALTALEIARRYLRSPKFDPGGRDAVAFVIEGALSKLGPVDRGSERAKA